MYGIQFVNKKVLGLMKDENNGAIMNHEFRAKMYALRVDGKKNMKKAKGIKRNSCSEIDNVRQLHAMSK